MRKLLLIPILLPACLSATWLFFGRAECVGFFGLDYWMMVAFVAAIFFGGVAAGALLERR